MYRHKHRHQHVEHESLDRWLVSYADYMTLMFALFVVLYAMAIIKEEDYTVLSETLTTVFDEQPVEGSGVKGEGLLTENQPIDTEFELYGTSLLDEKGPELVDEQVELSEVEKKKTGRPLAAMEEALKDALLDLQENGYARVERSDDWLTIALDNRLLFSPGSASLGSSASVVLQEVYQIVGPVNNFIRIRGYTDDTPIRTELFASNWELSVARAMAVLKIFENLNVAPARMAVEGYGQYSPFVDNQDADSRAENRKVVIAVSKYELQPVKKAAEPSALENSAQQNSVQAQQQTATENQDHDTIQVIKLPGGGIRITTRKDDTVPKQGNNGDQQ